MKSCYDIEDIGKDINPCYWFTARELAPHFGVSRKAVYRLVHLGKLYAEGGLRDGRYQWLVPGWGALEFIKDNPDYFIRFSAYGGKPRAAKPMWFMMLGKERGRKKQGTTGLKAKVYAACNTLQEQNGPVTVRSVRAIVHARTKDICPFVARWKQQASGLKPKRAA